MRKDVRELINWAESIGYSNEGHDGNGHYRLRHLSGETYSVPATPSDYRSLTNCKSDLRKRAGVAHDGPRAGRYSKGSRGTDFSLDRARQEKRDHLHRKAVWEEHYREQSLREALTYWRDVWVAESNEIAKLTLKMRTEGPSEKLSLRFGRHAENRAEAAREIKKGMRALGL